VQAGTEKALSDMRAHVLYKAEIVTSRLGDPDWHMVGYLPNSTAELSCIPSRLPAISCCIICFIGFGFVVW
jgi:hypothetical protein